MDSESGPPDVSAGVPLPVTAIDEVVHAVITDSNVVCCFWCIL